MRKILLFVGIAAAGLLAIGAVQFYSSPPEVAPKPHYTEVSEWMQLEGLKEEGMVNSTLVGVKVWYEAGDTEELLYDPAGKYASTPQVLYEREFRNTEPTNAVVTQAHWVTRKFLFIRVRTDVLQKVYIHHLAIEDAPDWDFVEPTGAPIKSVMEW